MAGRTVRIEQHDPSQYGRLRVELLTPDGHLYEAVLMEAVSADDVFSWNEDFARITHMWIHKGEFTR